MQSQPVLRVAALVACAMFAASPGFCAGGLEGCQTAARQDPAPDELEVLRRALSQPGGGEARREREAAVDALLRRREPRAHEYLAAVIVRGDDPDGAARFVLQSLDRLLARPADTVFGDEKLRQVALRIYVPAVVRLFAIEAPLRPERDPTGLLPLARRFLEEMTFKERREGFEALANGGDATFARAALLAAGASRDLALAPWIAARLEQPDLAAAARTALSALTFAEEPFADRAAFEAWFERFGDVDYTELAEQAALRGAEAAARVRLEADRESVALTSKLVAALARAEAPSWSQIAGEVLGARSEDATSAHLLVLRDVLAQRVDGGARLGGAVPDRQAFAREIRLRLGRLADRPEDFALNLETLAYLAVHEDAAQRQLVEAELLASLSSEAPEIRRAAFRGLRRFPSVDNRGQVVAAAEEALSGRDDATLAEALACLRAASWSSPSQADPDRESWLVLLRRVLAAPELDIRLKEDALQIAVLRDASDALVDDAFDLLVGVARSSTADVSLRRQALSRLLVFTRVPAHADDYVRCALDLLVDPDPAIRRLAAHQLTTLPETTEARRADWLAEIVARASSRLREEDDERALRELLDCMLRAAEQPGTTRAVLDALVDAARATAARETPDEAFRKNTVVDGLRILGVGRSRAAADWLAAAAALASLQARDALVAVLERQHVSELAEGADPSIEPAMRLVLAAAQMKPANQRWADLPDEAERVRRAFDALQRIGKPANAPAERALRVTVLSGLGRPAEVVVAGAAALADKAMPLGPDERITVLRAVAGAHLDQAELGPAERRIVELDGLAPNSPAVLGLWTRLAHGRAAAGSSRAAAEILGNVLSKIPVDDPAWRELFLALAEARLDADGEGNRAAVLEDLSAEAERFAGEGVPSDVAARYAELLGRVQG